jgi:hypothetical protein
MTIWNLFRLYAGLQKRNGGSMTSESPHLDPPEGSIVLRKPKFCRACIAPAGSAQDDAPGIRAMPAGTKGK